jgi:phosphohistidine swiveling domain-containing protein
MMEPIEAIVPRRAQRYGEFVRRVALLARAGLPLPPGYASARDAADAFYASCLEEPRRLPQLLDPAAPLPREEALGRLRREMLEASAERAFAGRLSEVYATLRSLGAESLTVSAFLVCDKVQEERPLGEVQLGIDSEASLSRAILASYAAPFELGLLRVLRAAGVRDASVAIMVQRMLDGFVSGVVYTRHPITSDASEWLVRTGYGLPSGVRTGRVASDVIRVSRDGFVRDRVVVDKPEMLRAGPGGRRELVPVPEPLIKRPCLTDAGLHEVLRLSARTERQVGRAVRIDWAVLSGRVYLLRVEPLPGEAKPPRARAAEPEVRERALWSYSELGEALPLPPTPLGWSLLAKFSRGGLASALAAAGAALGAAPELLIDVRGRPYLNVGVLTEAACRLPGLSPEVLARVGLDLPPELREPGRAGPLDAARSVLRLYDSHVRFGERLAMLASRMADDRGHITGLDARLLSPDAVERVLCDVEAFMGDASIAMMRVYGNWLATLLALRSLLARHLGADALRIEKELLWGPTELPSVETGYDFLRVGRALARDPRALAWADGDEQAPGFVLEALDEFAQRHRFEGMFLFDPRSPRWRETPRRLQGMMRAMLTAPLSLALSAERRELAKGRRERAEREWRRQVPLIARPVVQLLLARVRQLTQQRDKLLLDLVHGISMVREIVVDASRRLSTRHRELGTDAAFFLDLAELHAALARGHWDVQARVEMRSAEHTVLAALPRAVARFHAYPADERAQGEPIIGAMGSSGASEGRVYRVQGGDELETLPPDAVLVVSACDIGMAGVLPAVRGVVAEQGGALSHGAALAHALGVPVVLGVPNALARLRDGERVRVDADACRVERL